jgi:glycosyltransferase involved in cell wall biosynthesis
MTSLVSILIPLYNFEGYIAQALDSLLSQTYSNLEIVVAQTGSTDQTQAILERYAKKDPRVHIIQTPDKKDPIDSRQLAYEHCHGDYVMSLDADDYLDSDFFAKSIAFMESNQLDISTCRVVTCTENKEIIHEEQAPFPKSNFVFNKPEDYRFLLGFRYGGWSKLCRHDYLQKIGYSFNQGRELGLYVACFYDDCHTGYCRDAVYYYVQRPDSLSHNFSKAIKQNQNPRLNDIQYFDLANKVLNTYKRSLVEMYLVKTQIPIVLFHAAGDKNYKANKEIKKIKKWNHYSFSKMKRAYPYFAPRTQKIAKTILYHGTGLLLTYIKMKAKS